jgi:ABC-type multidrug transport system fused ATPase/permease subunit
MSDDNRAPEKRVRHFRQILLWPLQLMPIRADAQVQKHWEVLEQDREDNPWHEVLDEFTGDPAQFKERHYNEFVTFLPHVQRFIYGESRRAGQDEQRGASPMRVFRREDVVAARLVLSPGDAPLTLSVAHIDLYFFFDIDVVLLAVEVFADDLPLVVAEDVLYRFGRAYPAGWDQDGQGLHCAHKTEWLSPEGAVLAVSDYEKRDKYLSFVCRHRAPCLAAHWAFLLRPLVLDHADERGVIRYRQIEYYRMPVMGYLAMEKPKALSRGDFIRLGLVTAAGSDEALPYSDRHVTDFEENFCYDRYWSDRIDERNTRYLCCGHALIAVGDANTRVFTDRETGVFSQFRHQYFLLFLIAHFHKAALLMISDRLVHALNRLEVHNAESVKVFKRAIRQQFEIFLRFTHRYWFHELSDQAQSKALYRLCARHLGTDALFEEVRDEIEKMSGYLDSDSLRRQANTVVRLTVVTTFGLIGTLCTGFLGMNLIDAADQPLWQQALLFLLFFLPSAALILFFTAKSKPLSDFLEALSDERLPYDSKLVTVAEVWRRRQRPVP